MTLRISKVFTYDEDAGNYIQAVEGASGDNQALEPAVRQAINNFVVGCKQDNIWSAIKASCILAGARTLNGALVPLVGAAPTNYNFVAGDYNRKTGLIGNGSTKYLDSNKAPNAQPLNSLHLASFISTADTAANRTVMGASSFTDATITAFIQADGGNLLYRLNNGGTYTNGSGTGFFGASRSVATSFTSKSYLGSVIHTVSSTTATANTIHIFNRNLGTGIFQASAARLAFYSIGESLDLTLLDARVTALINALSAAIP